MDVVPTEYDMKLTKSVVLPAFYYIVLAIITVICLTYDSSAQIQITARFSPWQFPHLPNLVQYTVDNPGNASLGNRKTVMTGWHDKDDDAFRLADDIRYEKIPQNGVGYFQLPGCTYQYGMHCGDLSFSLLNTDETDKEKLDDEFYFDAVIGRHSKRIVDTKKFQSDLIFFDNPEDIYIPKYNSYTVIPFGREHQAAPLSLNTAEAPAAFLPGVPNRVLYADIRDGEPYAGNIEIEQIYSSDNTAEDNIHISNISYHQQPGNGAPHYTIEADVSGVTSFLLAIQKKTRIRFTAGDNIYEKAFEPLELPFNAFVIGDFVPFSEPYISVTFPGEPQDMVVDFFTGNAWFGRQEVAAENTGRFALKLPPGIVFGKSGRAWHDNVGIVYARLSLNGFPQDKAAQTFALISSGDTIEDRFKIGAIYQNFVKLHDMDMPLMDIDSAQYHKISHAAERIFNLYKAPDAQKESWCSDIFAVVPALLNDRNMYTERGGRQTLSVRDMNIEAFLRHRLARAHRPWTLSAEFGANPALASSRSTANKFWIIWLIAGIIAFLVYGLRLRNLRQKAWFDAAAQNKAEGLLPGMPLWIVATVVLLCLAFAYAMYTAVQLL